MENENMQNGAVKEINLAFLLGVLKKCWIFVLIATVVFAGIGAAYTLFFDKPVYKGTASFYVNNVPAAQQYVSQAQTSAAISIALSCVELADQDTIVRQAVCANDYKLARELGFIPHGEAYDFDKHEEAVNRCVLAVRSLISAKKGESNTVIFYVTAASTNKDVTYKVIQAMQEEFPKCLSTVMGMNQTSATPMLKAVGEVKSELDIVAQKDSPLKTAFMGAAVGAVACYAVFFCIKLKKDN